MKFVPSSLAHNLNMPIGKALSENWFMLTMVIHFSTYPGMSIFNLMYWASKLCKLQNI